MNRREKIAGIIIFILTIPYGIYGLSSLYQIISLIMNNSNTSTRMYKMFSSVLFSNSFFVYIPVFLLGIFALPFFRKHRNLLLIPLLMIFLSAAFSSVRFLIFLIGKSGLSGTPITVPLINSILNPQITDFFNFLLSLSIILYYLVKKIRVILPAVVLVISLIGNIGINAVYFTSWYWNLFPEDQIREVGLTSIFAIFLILVAIYFHFIFFLLLAFIKPNSKNEDAPQIMTPELQVSSNGQPEENYERNQI